MLNPEILPLKKWGDAGFDESKVRRDGDGKFAPKGSGQKQRSKTHDQVAQVAGAGAGLAASAATIGAGRAIGHAVGARRGERDQLRRDRDHIKQAYRAGGGPRPTHQRAEELASAARRKIQEEAAARGESGPEVDRRAEQMYRKVKQSRSKENPGKRDARIKGSVNMARQIANTSRVIGRVRGGAMGAARGGLAALGPAVLAGSAAYGAVHGSSLFDKASALDDFGVKALRKWGDAGFDESKVRRDDDGKFAPKGGGGAPVSGAPRKHYGVVRDSKGNLFSIHDESAIGEGITIDKDGYIRSGDRTYVLDARTGSPVEIKAPAAPTVQTRSNGDREKRSRLAGAGHYGLRGAAAGAAIGAAGGAAYGSRYGRAGILAGALGGAMSGAKTGAIGGGIYGAVAPGYKRAVKKASAFDDFGVRALRKWGDAGEPI